MILVKIGKERRKKKNLIISHTEDHTPPFFYLVALQYRSQKSGYDMDMRTKAEIA